MNWIISIDNQTHLRYYINYDPYINIVTIFGQYKPKNKDWENITEKKIPYTSTFFEHTYEMLSEEYENMISVRDCIEELCEGFTIIGKSISVIEPTE